LRESLIRLLGPLSRRANYLTAHAPLREELKALLRMVDRRSLPALRNNLPGVADERRRNMDADLPSLHQSIKRVPGGLPRSPYTCRAVTAIFVDVSVEKRQLVDAISHELCTRWNISSRRLLVMRA